MLELFTVIGFALAGYSVIANDSVQTLGTWIASNRDKFKWTTLWAAASSVLIVTIVYGWYTNDHDISFGRLAKIPYIEPQWYHAMAPLALVLLTRRGIPVSTSFLVLSAFASTFVLEKMLLKSILGYGLAAIVAYVLWLLIARVIDEKDDVSDGAKKFWRVFQWCSTGFLWFTWLSHDVANIAVFLPRDIAPWQLILVLVFFVVGLAHIFYNRGGAIQQIVMDKQSTKYVRSATMIDLVYAFLLLYFKQLNNIPMSTTWVFVGLLCGRELALNTGLTKKGNLKSIFPIVAKDFLKLIVGLSVSVAIVLAIHYGTDGAQNLEQEPAQIETAD
ncbi:MAG: hypothetical protein P8K81_04820 [Flavobacteriales bacterium]|nr:hypothetical protein [Flavobacteriales bacterium]